MANRFRIIKPTATDGHKSTVLETRELLTEWVEGVDFSGLNGNMIVAVEDTIVKSAADFWEEVDKIVDQFPDKEIEIREIPQLVGG